MRKSFWFGTRFARLFRGILRGFCEDLGPIWLRLADSLGRRRFVEKQTPPLRYAPVGMTRPTLNRAGDDSSWHQANQKARLGDWYALRRQVGADDPLGLLEYLLEGEGG
jgi:hypothetical protein